MPFSLQPTAMTPLKWSYLNNVPEDQIVLLQSALGVDRLVARLLVQRGVTSFEAAKNFFRPTRELLHDPFLMSDMEAAVARLHRAVESQEKILIYGDYDVDGTTSVALVYSLLRNLGVKCSYYIPDRNTEGYGVSAAGIDHANEVGATLVIALDLGIKAMEMVRKAAALGIDFIICDHHLPEENLPAAVAVLDPKRPDCPYPFKELSGCGIGFKLMQAYTMRHADPEIVFEFADLVAVSIASDIVAVTGENRVLTAIGLKKLNEKPCHGLNALLKIAGVKKELDVNSVVFTLGPRINAAGRVAHAHSAVELLVAQQEEEADELAASLNSKNTERRIHDLSITEEAMAMIDSDENLRNASATVVYKETWHKGVIGIVASRLLEKYYRPTIVLTLSNGKITGSARSINGFDLHAAIESCADLLEKFGGHRYAAGLTLDPAKLEPFRQRFEKIVAASLTEDMRIPVIEIDAVVEPDELNMKYLRIQKQMAPFGPGNLQPVFELKNVSVYGVPTLAKERHLRLAVGAEHSPHRFSAVCFDRPDLLETASSGAPLNIVFHLEENTWNGVTSLQLRLKDICRA
ncbi:MAG: single-stranded-DNA-specific exonuclease RecJ [Bacteroidetes bacterium]|nr:single-stranded-DNA-specific exonuclease RecJ [Bacteroidota bacterium]